MHDWLAELHADNPWMPLLLAVLAATALVLIGMAINEWQATRKK
jgi:hypothetical protein